MLSAHTVLWFSLALVEESHALLFFEGDANTGLLVTVVSHPFIGSDRCTSQPVLPPPPAVI